MDFSLSEDQQAIGDLAAKILAEKGSHEQQRALEKRGGPRFDRELWRAVADAGLLGISVPEQHAGAGLGFLEVAAILEQVGRRTAPIPLFETVVLAALPIAEFGSAAQRAAWLPKIASGEAIGTAALVEDAPSSAARDGDGFRLSGKKLCVPAAEFADVVLVPAEIDGQETIFLVDPKAPGVSLDPMATTSGLSESLMTLSGVRVGPDAVLGGTGAGAKVRAWLELRATAALCMISLGACEAALDLTSEYIKTRKQFDQPIAMFQAVGHRGARRGEAGRGGEVLVRRGRQARRARRDPPARRRRRGQGISAPPLFPVRAPPRAHARRRHTAAAEARKAPRCGVGPVKPAFWGTRRRFVS